MKKYNVFCLLSLFLLSIDNHLISFEYNWVMHDAYHQNPIWIVAPGIFNTTRVSARYCGKKGFITYAGESIINSSSIDIAMDVFVDNTQHPEIIPLRQLAISPLSLTVVGLVQQIKYAHSKLVKKYNKKIESMHSFYQKNNTPPKNDNLIQEHSIRLSQLNIAQQNDINTLYNRYDACTKKLDNRPQIWIGHSRGAATVFNTLALKKCPQVNLAILEACFDSMSQVFLSYQPAWALKLRGHKFLEWLLVNLTSHDIDGICPLNLVSLFPHHIPVLFITSKKDRAVPIACTKNLAQLLANAGHKNVYLFVLEHSTHSGYTCESEYDKTNYQNIVHALYKKLHFPYIPAYAQSGVVLLEQSHIQAAPII